MIDIPLPPIVLTVGAWAMWCSRVSARWSTAVVEPWERFGWAPYAATTAVLSLVVALSPA